MTVRPPPVHHGQSKIGGCGRDGCVEPIRRELGRPGPALQEAFTLLPEQSGIMGPRSMTDGEGVAPCDTGLPTKAAPSS